MKKLKSVKFFRQKYQGSAISLCSIKLDDVDQVFNLLYQGDFHQFTFIPKEYSYSMAKNWVEKQVKNPQTFAIFLPEYKKMIGVIGIVVDDFSKCHWEISYWLGQKYRGKGYMKEALNLFLKKVKQDTPIKKISARVFLKNSKSLKLLKESGFIKEGLLQNHFCHNSQMKSVVIMGLRIK